MNPVGVLTAAEGRFRREVADTFTMEVGGAPGRERWQPITAGPWPELGRGDTRGGSGSPSPAQEFTNKTRFQPN